MAPNALDPGFVDIQYHSEFGPHNMILPVNTPNVVSPDGFDSTIDTWDAGTINWRAMTEALVTLMADQMPISVNFDFATLWYQLTPTSDPGFVDNFTLDIAGTAATPGWYKAVQHTIVAYDTDGNIAKLVLLDAGSGNTFDRETDPAAAGYDDLLTEWFLSTNGWSSRFGARPATFRSGFKTLNEKLRRAYRMA